MPSPEEAPSQPPIEDIDAAREAAYAEKPARDYIAEYKDQLSDEARGSLAWIASQEAEKALKRYEETKDEEDPVVRILRERALESIEFPEEIRTDIMDRKKERMLGARGVQVREKQWVAGCEWALRDLGAELIEATLTDKHLELSQKQAVLGHLGPGLQSGVWDAYRGRIIETHDAEHYQTEQLWGNFVGNLMANRGIEAVGPLQHKVSPRVLEQIMGFLGRARISHPEIAENLDGDLSRRGWLWDKRKNTYIPMS